ncbi:LysR family transcriptional regulator [Rhizobium sp. MC63]|uniref:LysR family transcriptional regulator n=1 Tax=Rhizobium mulingense TaxID=3031128 RepID=A0ACC6N4C4_9HYPH|nr:MULTISPECIES: LysR family transcriptional regulator [unclassified Rhizobium]MDF0699478.1 LysR family transcriptional regulator [Rhizobium sp. MC63]MEA3519796.1 LysR family transcriptional regulator [Rhizobium sp. MJ31]
MDFRQMETCVSIASGSFGRAANRLHITQPAISLRISGLEEELGVKLLDRLNGSIQLTATGLELLACAEGVLERAHLQP